MSGLRTSLAELRSDLALAVVALAAMGELPPDRVRRVVHVAELGLDGRLRHVAGVLPAALAAQQGGCDHVVVAPEDVAEAQLVDGVRVSSAESLHGLVAAYRRLSGEARLA